MGLSPALAGILDRLTDPTARLLDQAQRLADDLASRLVEAEVTDSDGDPSDYLAYLASELAGTITELARLHDSHPGGA